VTPRVRRVSRSSSLGIDSNYKSIYDVRMPEWLPYPGELWLPSLVFPLMLAPSLCLVLLGLGQVVGFWHLPAPLVALGQAGCIAPLLLVAVSLQMARVSRTGKRFAEVAGAVESAGALTLFVVLSFIQVRQAESLSWKLVALSTPVVAALIMLGRTALIVSAWHSPLPLLDGFVERVKFVFVIAGLVLSVAFPWAALALGCGAAAISFFFMPSIARTLRFGHAFTLGALRKPVAVDDEIHLSAFVLRSAGVPRYQKVRLQFDNETCTLARSRRRKTPIGSLRDARFRQTMFGIEFELGRTRLLITPRYCRRAIHLIQRFGMSLEQALSGSVAPRVARLSESYAFARK
jgi:hypothetical protein